MSERGFVGEDAVERRAGDPELARGTQFVAAIEIEDVLNMLADSCVESEVSGTGCRCAGR